MPEAFLRELLKNGGDLLAAILRFNAPPAARFFPDALPEPAARLLREGTLAGLEGSRAGRARVRAYLLRQAGADPENFFLDFRDKRRRLALLERETLVRLASLCGACIYAPEASRCVLRKEVLTLRAALGPDYDHILSRGRFQWEQSRACFKTFRPESPLPERMRAAGQAALRLCMADWPQALRRRADPLLPAELRSAGNKALSCPADFLPGIWLDVKKLLLKEVAPQWQACFA
ncbi:MAG: Yop proteins translocation protein K [Deltaproteobacteria bacterium]|jgi:hypothetical protein|nr:Yop proteins translocation protein K [Deltaproteobacteria bacterium]